MRSLLAVVAFAALLWIIGITVDVWELVVASMALAFADLWILVICVAYCPERIFPIKTVQKEE